MGEPCMKMNYFSFLRIATKHIICEKCLNITQVLFEFSNSGLAIFWIYSYVNLGVIGVHHGHTNPVSKGNEDILLIRPDY